MNDTHIIEQNSKICQLTGIDEILQWPPNLPLSAETILCTRPLILFPFPFAGADKRFVTWSHDFHLLCGSLNNFVPWKIEKTLIERSTPFFAPLPPRIDGGKTRPARFRPQMIQDAFRHFSIPAII
ncbi:hypothetical protein [Agrobacterium vitis]|uniref:hypothetical protein n=1 Tax=Agrobacterium vitis TaxID=373 RepID=UPI0012E8D883|nr:hypothetical protein [Agrobacterium vitis]MVA63767.1 hypothetical protein [Agrobacterium vitis]